MLISISISARLSPAAVFGGGMELQARQDAASLRRGEGLVERAGGVGVEVVLHHADAFCVWVALLHQIAQHFGVVPLGAMFGDRDMAPTGKRLDQDEEVGRAVPCRAVPLVLVVPTLDVAGSRRQGGAHIRMQHDRFLVESRQTVG
jgi:hypothetical protein